MPPVADAVEVRAAGPDEWAAVAAARARCYATGYSGMAAPELADPEWGDAAAGDFLLATRRGRAVGTLTALTGRIGVRGRPMPCQGVAWVGTAHDARRSGGVGAALVRRGLDLARQRGQVLSALVPFRASYYETFGYGLCERHARWHVPLSLLPGGAGDDGFELIDPDDAESVAAVAACRSRQVDGSHGDLTFDGPLDGFGITLARCRREGYLFARRDPGDATRVTAFVRTVALGRRGEGIGLAVPMLGYDAPGDFPAILRFLGSLRDQYGFANLSTPPDCPLNRLLREPQLPHRGVEHLHATCDVGHRLQARILDHARFFDETPWPDAAATGRATVAVREPEGGVSRVTLEVAEGRCAAKAMSGASADFACDAKTWAAVAMGDLRASTAAELGLADINDYAATALLDTLTHGPPPFCRESF